MKKQIMTTNRAEGENLHILKIQDGVHLGWRSSDRDEILREQADRDHKAYEM